MSSLMSKVWILKRQVLVDYLMSGLVALYFVGTGSFLISGIRMDILSSVGIGRFSIARIGVLSKPGLVDFLASELVDFLLLKSVDLQCRGLLILDV